MRTRFWAQFWILLLSGHFGLGTIAKAELVLPSDLREFAFKLQRHVESQDLFTLESCPAFLEELYRGVYTRRPHEFSLESVMAVEDGELVARPDGKPRISPARSTLVLNSFFRSRLALGDKLHEFIAERLKQGQSSDQIRRGLAQCVTYLRVTHRALRSWEDFWGYWLIEQLGNQESESGIGATDSTYRKSYGMFEGPRPYNMLRPGLDFPEGVDAQQAFPADQYLQTGHMVMTKGNTFTGSIISRIGAVDNQFSHIAWVFRDDEELFKRVDPAHVPGKLYIIEATLDKGLYWIPFSEWRTHHQARTALFRYRHINPEGKVAAAEVAKRGARHLALLAIEGKTGYNFRMDLSDRTNLFCSQTIEVGLEKACEELSQESGSPACDDLPFPLFQGEFRHRNPMLPLLEISVRSTFAPADVEVDPRLELLAEWRDYSSIRRSTLLDAAITKVFQWMEFDGYHFNQALAPPEFRNQFRWLTTLGHTLVTELGRMPANLPRGFVDGSVLMGYMIEHQGFGPERFLRGYESVGRHVGLYPYINEMDRLHRERGRALAARNEYRDFPLSEFEVDRALEALRGFDCANLRRQLNGESLTAPLQFHGFFRTSFSDNDIACPEGQMPWDVLN